MTDEQNKPEASDIPTPKPARRRTATKKKVETTPGNETPANMDQSGTPQTGDTKAATTTAPKAAPKSTRSRSRKPASAAAPKTAAKAEAGDGQPKAPQAAAQAAAETTAAAQTAPKAAPKPTSRSTRKSSTKSPRTSGTAPQTEASALPHKTAAPKAQVPLDLSDAPFAVEADAPKARDSRDAGKDSLSTPAQDPGTAQDKGQKAAQDKTQDKAPNSTRGRGRSRKPAAKATALTTTPAAGQSAVPTLSPSTADAGSHSSAMPAGQPTLAEQHSAPTQPTPAEQAAAPTRTATVPAASTSEEGWPVQDLWSHESAWTGDSGASATGHSDDEPADREAAASDAEGEEAQPRKSRRGRRGGRGRGRGKARLAAQAEAAAQTEDSPAPVLPLADEDEDDSDDDEYSAPPARTSGRDNERGRGRSAAEAKGDSRADAKADAEGKLGRRKMFISVVPGEQVEVALVEEGTIHEYYLEMLHQAKAKGNIYKGVVHNVDTNLQAAFVSYGAHKNGFLQIDEIHPEYYLTPHETGKGKKFPPIQKVIKPGQEVLVQVVKEPTGNKGAFLTTWLSLAGRFLVLTPGQEQIGVSRKVDNDEERSRLREMMNGIEPGEGLGVIVRTVSAGTSKTTLKNDLQYLKRVWKEIRRRGTAEAAPCLIYKESGLAERAVRDYLTEDVCEVWVDNESVADSLRETVALLFPRKKDLVRVHVDLRQTLWERFNIQRQLEQIYSREVVLPSGGRLVFDQTEALMAIDINSGKISGKGNFESMALKTNLEAAEAIARHLKLRDIGGQVVIDFIEMRDKNHVRDVEKVLRNAMKNDRARHDVARMSSFGLLEIVRQRTGSSALAVTMEPCPCCGGTGIRRNMEWQSLQALRQIGRQARIPGNGRCVYEATAELGMYLLNHKRDRLREMEQQLNVAIEIRIQP